MTILLPHQETSPCMKLKKLLKKMKTEISRILSLSNFFTAKNNNKFTYVLKPSSTIIVHNIYISWLGSINAKAQSQFPVYLSSNKKENNVYCGFIKKLFNSYPQDIEIDEEKFHVMDKSKLKLNFTVPKQDVMQYFFQWQRYRKYWWSSITTTPSLFIVNDMNYENENAHTQIVANFKKEPYVVEHLSINNNKCSRTSDISCSISMEKALISLLLDGMLNESKDGYLKLHNKMAPYKISFALDTIDDKKLDILKELAMLLHNKLNIANINSVLPEFSNPLYMQIEENFKFGVPYTAILSNETLSNGIFQLLNSSTMLREQLHIADFENYASLLCR